jgi:DNA-directed RNA polymerase specialized sigma24 family protein
LEKAVLRLRCDDWDHDTIAATLGIPEGKSRKVFFQVMKKLMAVAKQITLEEWQVLRLKITEEKSPAQIASLLGLPESRVQVLWHYAMEQLMAFPELHARLTKSEWQVLQWSLEGHTRAEVCARSGHTCPEVIALLKSGIEKLHPSPSPKRRRH